MDSSWVNKIVTWIPILGALYGLFRWIFSLKQDIKDAHDRIDELEKRHEKLEDRIDVNMKAIHERIDDCKDSILKSLQSVLQAISKN